MSYNKFDKVPNLYYADVDIPIKIILKDNKLDVDNVIVDIVTPKEVFVEVIGTYYKQEVYCQKHNSRKTICNRRGFL